MNTLNDLRAATNSAVRNKIAMDILDNGDQDELGPALIEMSPNVPRNERGTLLYVLGELPTNHASLEWLLTIQRTSSYEAAEESKGLIIRGRYLEAQ